MKKYKGETRSMDTQPCINHRGGKDCPVYGNKCNLLDNVYNAKIITDTSTYNYIGISEQPMRKRVAMHKYSFKTDKN